MPLFIYFGRLYYYFKYLTENSHIVTKPCRPALQASPAPAGRLFSVTLGTDLLRRWSFRGRDLSSLVTSPLTPEESWTHQADERL